MCSPEAAGASTGLQAVGGLMAGQQAAGNEKLNEAAYTSAAMRTIQAGDLRARDEGTRGAQILGRQLSGQAAGNIQTGGNTSAAAVRADTIRTGQQSLAEILTNTDNSVQVDEAQARAAAARSSQDSFNSLIGAGASVGDDYVKWQGAFNPTPGGGAAVPFFGMGGAGGY